MRSFSMTRRVGRRSKVAAALATAALLVLAQPAAAERPRVYAITGATLITAPGEVIEGGTIVLRDGLIEAVGTDAVVPADAEVIDGDGMTVYAGWIDAYSHLGMQSQQGGGGGGGFNIAALFQPEEAEPGTSHPIELVHPQYRVTSELEEGSAEIGQRREQGFTAALAVPRSGIFRGWSALVALRDGHPRELVVKATVAQHLGYDTGSFFGGYPADLLGAVATIRQVYYDTARYVEWRRRYEADPSGMARPAYNDAMEALAPMMIDGGTMIVYAAGNRAIERTLALATELDGDPIILGGGDEQQIIDLLRQAGTRLIVPVDFPTDPDVSKPERLPAISLTSLQEWERAPSNPGALEAAGIAFALTPYGMGNAGKFAENVRKAIDAGLSGDTALAAVTTIPAEMLGVSASMGTLEAGKIANLVVATGEPFGEETEIRHVFVDGVHHEMEETEEVGNPDAVVDPRGEWAVTTTVMGNERSSTWIIEGDEGDYSGRSIGQQGERDFESVELAGNALTLVLPGPRGSLEATVVIEGDELTGTASVEGPGGRSITLDFRGERTSGPQGGGR